MDRIIEIKWAVKNEKAFVPSPKPVQKSRTKKPRPSKMCNMKDENMMDIDQKVERTRAGDYEYGMDGQDSQAAVEWHR